MSAQLDEVKEVIVFRRDLLKNQRVVLGKVSAQIAHAAMAWIADRYVKCGAMLPLSSDEEEWLCSSQTKVVCECADEAEMTLLHSVALSAGLQSHLITDEGRTAFDGAATLTALCIGPSRCSVIDTVTGHLKLLR